MTLTTPDISYTSTGNNAAEILRDVGDGVSRVRLWWALALEDMQQRYKRSYVGLLWTTLSFAFFVFVKAIIFGPISGRDMNYFAVYLTLSFFAWTFMTTAVSDACGVFTTSENWMKGSRLPLTLFVMQAVTRNMITTFYNFLVVLVIMIIFRPELGPVALASIPIFGLFLLNAFWLCFVLGTITARYRDVLHLIQTIMRVAFFLSPVLWTPDQIGELWNYLKYNPFAHFLISFREPIIDGAMNWTSLSIVLAITAGGFVAAFLTMLFARKRLIFWL